MVRRPDQDKSGQSQGKRVEPAGVALPTCGLRRRHEQLHRMVPDIWVDPDLNVQKQGYCYRET